MSQLNTRALACAVLRKVLIEGKSFGQPLINTLQPQLEPRDGAFVMVLCFGVLRFYPRLQGALQTLLARPLKAKDADLNLLLMVGLYQLYYTDIPAYAAISNTVDATQNLGKPWAKGLLNGVLRNALRQGKDLPHAAPLSQQFNHPDWLICAVQSAWPLAWQEILQANCEHAPLSLRVNLQKISREAYLVQLAQAGLEGQALIFSPAGIVLKEAVSVYQLPGFTQGLVSVQDEAAQLAAALLDLKAQQRVLDACAAPGGKTAHLLEMEKDLRYVLAIDNKAHRLALVEQTLERLQLNAQTRCADASNPTSWWNGEGFDRILLDAPCSATGVIRRHPDIKHHRQPEDILSLSQQQQTLLTTLWPLLKPGGILLYATCSILPQENAQTIAAFLEKHADAQEWPILEAWGCAQLYGRQILPGQDHMDGFYYARLRKRA